MSPLTTGGAIEKQTGTGYIKNIAFLLFPLLTWSNSELYIEVTERKI